MSLKTGYWLMKSEPNSYSIADLKRDKTAFWDGVRNYQARNFMMRDMQIGDKALFYHSNAKPSGVAGLAVICAKATADKTALDPKSIYFDPRATKKKPIWHAVTVQFVTMFSQIIPLSEIRQEKALCQMALLRRGQRLSILPVTKKEYEHIVEMSQQRAKACP